METTAVQKSLTEKTQSVSPTMKMMREAFALAEQGMSINGISQQLEKSEGWVKGSLLIVEKLPSSVHKAIENNHLGRLAALQLLLCPEERLEKVVEACVMLAEKENIKL